MMGWCHQIANVWRRYKAQLCQYLINLGRANNNIRPHNDHEHKCKQRKFYAPGSIHVGGEVTLGHDNPADATNRWLWCNRICWNSIRTNLHQKSIKRSFIFKMRHNHSYEVIITHKPAKKSYHATYCCDEWCLCNIKDGNNSPSPTPIGVQDGACDVEKLLINVGDFFGSNTTNDIISKIFKQTAQQQILS